MNSLIYTRICCPYCGENIDVTIDLIGETQEYIEDCQVCCRPISFLIRNSNNEKPSIEVRAENDTF